MKKLKGFTLIECLIALAIFGIASLIMAQVFAMVSQASLRNHQDNISLGFQMGLAEQKTVDAGDVITSTFEGGTGSVGGQRPQHGLGFPVIQLTFETDLINYDGNTENYNFSMGVNIHALRTRDAANLAVGEEEESNNLRYKYLTPEDPTP